MATGQLNRIPAAAGAIANTAETAVFTTPALQNGTGSAGTWVSGDIQITPGTGTTAVTLRCRYGGGTGGALVDSVAAPVIPVSAGVATSIPFNFFDTSNTNEVQGGVQYTLTIQQTGGTATGSVNGGHMGMEV